MIRLQTSNTLQVRLMSGPGGFLVLTLYASVPPPTLTRLESPSLPVTEGGTGLLAATISAVQPEPTVVALESSDPAVASVPAGVTVAAGQLTAEIPVTGVAPGTAWIRASLNGTSLQSAITVRPSGPTLTDLAPATLQITQGASGTLTLTLSSAQATDTLVSLTSSDAAVIGLPPDGSVTVPAGQLTQAFAVFGGSPGQAAVTASLNGSVRISRVTVVIPLPTVVSLLPPVLPLTEGSSGTFTVTLNAAQPTPTDVFLATNETTVGLHADRVTVPVGALAARFSVTGLTRGAAMVTASLNGTSATAVVTVEPPPPTVQALACPPKVTQGATGLCTVALNATQLADTAVPVTSASEGILGHAGTLTVPASHLTTTFTVTGLAVGETALTVGPLNGTSRTVAIPVIPPPPTIVSLVPEQASLLVGASITVTLTLNAVQIDETAVPLASAPGGVLGHPAEIRVPAGALAAVVTLTGLTPGVATVTTGPLTSTSAQSILTVNQLPPQVTALVPGTLALPKGRAGALTLTIAPTQAEAIVVLLTSGAPGIAEVPGSVTVPAGAETATIPVLGKGEGEATVTAGPLNGSSAQALVAVTPAELLTLAVTPPAPAVPKGQTQAFTATGTYTDGTTRDLTGMAAWSSSDEQIAPVSAAGVATALADGQVTITATVGSQSATASLTVTPPILASLALVPAAATRLVGETLQLEAVGILTDGTSRDETANVATWASSDEAVATISTTGLATALGAGITTITATHLEGFPATATLSVTWPPPTIIKFEPASGKMASTVTITGTHLGATTGVAFNGTAASFTLVSATEVTATVPLEATTGPITVTTPGGSITTSGHFLVLPAPDVALLVEPASLPAVAGTTVSVAVRAVATGGYTGFTTLGVGALPDGVSASFSPPALWPSAAGVLTLSASASALAGAYPIQVRGTAVLDGTSVTRTATTTLEVLPTGLTSLAGQVRSETGAPLAKVAVRLASQEARTDAGGNFLLRDVPAGPGQLLLVDGTGASTPDTSYPVIPYKVSLTAGQPNTLGFTPYLHAQRTTGLVDISNSSAERVVTVPDLPGFEMRIPAGVQIIGWDGQPNTQVNIREVTLDRIPVPPIPADLVVARAYMFYFGKPGGGTATAPVPIRFPNDLDAPPGTQLQLWYYDEAPDGSRPNAWAQYGTGTVTADGRQVVPDIDPTTGKSYGQPRFCCGITMLAWWASQRRERDEQRGGDHLPPKGTQCGDPVDVATGLFVHEQTDLVLPGRPPIIIRRTYRPRGAAAGPFGPGTSHPYHVLLYMEYDTRTLYLPGGTRLAFPKQPDGTWRNTTDPDVRGAIITESNGIASLRFKDGLTWTFGAVRYGSTVFLASQRDRYGNTLLFTRAGNAGNLTAITDPASGRQLLLTYDGQNRITSIVDPLGRTVSYGYDGNNLATVTDPGGGVTRYTYDSQGRMETITNAREVLVVRNEYDAQGRVIRQTRADSGIWTYAYATTGPITPQAVVTQPEGQQIVCRANGRGYPLSATDGLGQTGTSTRDGATNLLTAHTDRAGRTTRYTYDPEGNVRTITDALNQTTTFTYDPTFHQVTSITDPLGNFTTFGYDAQGNVVTITDPEQNRKPEGERRRTTFTYNGAGQPLTATDPLGHTTTFEYDAVGNLTATVDPLGHRTERTYDAVSRLVAVKDANGAVTRFSYDVLDRLVAITDALTGTTRFTYDPMGNLLTVTDAKGQTTTHTYDPLDRLDTRTDALNRTERFTYDRNGNLQTHTDRKGQRTTHTYDHANRLTRTEYADGSFVAFTYDPAGNLLTATDSLTGAITRNYDALHRLVSETSPQGTVAYTYDAAGRRTTLQASGSAPVVSYAYDANSRLTGIVQGPHTVSLTYDDASRRTLLNLPNGVSTEYQYDEASRLIAQVYRSAMGVLGDLMYQYDQTGNRIGTSGSWARTLLPAAVLTTDYDVANEQLAFGETTQTFDANGNLVTQTDGTGTSTYTWDARNRLVAINGPSVAASFAYDALGRRSSKTVNGTTTAFLYDGLDAVAEQGPDGEASYLRTLAIDEALVRTDSTGLAVYLADILGSTMALTDATGAPGTTYAYAAFGDTAISGTPSLNAVQYTARENDGTGMYYYRARYYDRVRGRFVQEDPLRVHRRSATLYTYVDNGPMNYTDPFGLIKKCIRRLMLVTAYSDTGPGSDWRHYRGGSPASVGLGTVATANYSNTTGGPTRPATPVYPYGSQVTVYGANGRIEYQGEIHDTGAGWDTRHHNVSPDEWIDIWLPKTPINEAKKWGKQWREVEICHETDCP